MLGKLLAARWMTINSLLDEKASGESSRKWQPTAGFRRQTDKIVEDGGCRRRRNFGRFYWTVVAFKDLSHLDLIARLCYTVASCSTVIVALPPNEGRLGVDTNILPCHEISASAVCELWAILFFLAIKCTFGQTCTVTADDVFQNELLLLHTKGFFHATKWTFSRSFFEQKKEVQKISMYLLQLSKHMFGNPTVMRWNISARVQRKCSIIVIELLELL